MARLLSLTTQGREAILRFDDGLVVTVLPGADEPAVADWTHEDLLATAARVAAAHEREFDGSDVALPAVAAVCYRRQREAAYIAEMGDEPGPFPRTVGDVFDAFFRWVEAQQAAGAVHTDDMDAMLAKRADIKRRFPKPA
jgi:hypothetical protein